jgi:hypothetical protein
VLGDTASSQTLSFILLGEWGRVRARFGWNSASYLRPSSEGGILTSARAARTLSALSSTRSGRAASLRSSSKRKDYIHLTYQTLFSCNSLPLAHIWCVI